MFILYWIAFQVGANSVNIAYVSKKRGRGTFRKSVFGWVLACNAGVFWVGETLFVFVILL